MPSYYIWTEGCQMNKAESERLAAGFIEMGWQAADDVHAADVIILNSCVVRQSAENRVVNRIAALKTLKRSHPEKILAVTGCFVDSDTAALQHKFPQVDYFFKPGDMPSWLEFPARRIPRNPAVSAYVPVMQGCNNFCSYCIVPYRRGREVSRPLAEIVTEVRELVARGVKEVVLLGQNVDSYGRGLPGQPDLAELLAELNPIDGLARLRFLTNHPKDMSDRLITAMAKLDKVCEQVNLPVQAGDNDILKVMRRGYTVERYRDLISRLRAGVPGIAVTTDVIVGFPGETAAQFENTYGLLKDLRFDTVHVAAYSPRPGTTAARDLPDDVLKDEKIRRLKAVEALQEKIAGEINALLRDTAVEVLVEGRKGEKWTGRTRTDRPVFFTAPGDFTGRLVHVMIEKISPWSLQGQLA